MGAKRAQRTFLILVTFDLHGAKPAAYARVKHRLASLDLRKVIRSRSTGQLRPLPANTFVAKIGPHLPKSKSSPLRNLVRSQVKEILRQEGLRATVFVAIGQQWAWGTARV